MVSVDGAVKLLDFGVAKTLVGDAAADQVARGKWPYMSPEQVRGEPLDARSDLFSLGSLLYELLTGRQAFAGRTVVDSMRRVERADLPPAPGLEPGVQAILEQLLARRREDRFPNAGAALEAIGKALLQRGCTAPDRRLAALLDRLAEPDDDGFSDDEATGVLPPRVVAKMMQEQIAPRGRAPTLPTPSAPLPSPRSPIAPAKPPAPGSGDEDQVTLPPSGPRLPRAAAAAARAPVEDEPLEDEPLEEPTVVSFDGPQGLVGNAAPLEEEAEASDEAPCVQPALAAPPAPPPPATAPAATAQAPQVTTPWTLPPQEQADTPPPPPSPSEVEGGGLPWPIEPAAAPSPQRPRGSRNLLVITLALLAVLIAGLAVLLAMKQRREARKRGSSPPAQVAKADPSTRRDAAPSGAPDADAPREVTPGERATHPRSSDAGLERPVAPDIGPDRSAAQDAGPGRPAAQDAGPVRPAPPGAAAPPTGTAGGGEEEPLPRGRSPQGAPRKGELDVHSQPSGAWVLVDGQRQGKTPLRIDVPPGRKVQVALSRTGRALYRTPVWIPPGTGRRLDVILPFVPKIIYQAKPGRTALRVLCEGEGPNRVYLDALDTGFDCPTPPLAVLPVAHSVSVYFARTQRTHWKQFRPKAGQVNEVTLKE